ncbi:hypothetical protein EUBVEN_02835 [Eubacterium ventriosum ATCC 27560]|uniref:Uncharacterized protein n=1 Tax=Eubacterium ventriosum ATCC 27560 TaxID=411463 RepID=A5ZAT3_9FIRM|nr:hypothetical protein EUBVEN_02835 [Eubacterium ventriosum ATCC 27560]
MKLYNLLLCCSCLIVVLCLILIICCISCIFIIAIPNNIIYTLFYIVTNISYNTIIFVVNFS